MNQRFFSRSENQEVSCIINRIVLVLFTLLSLALVFVAITSKMLTPLLTGVLIGTVVILLLLVWLLSLLHPTKVRRTIATILALILSAAFAVGIYYAQITVNALKNITSGGVETAEMVVCVRIDDQRELSDLLRERFGVLEELDAHNTKAALLKIQDEFYVTANTKSYASASELVDALLNSDVNVMLINRAYLDMLSELDGYQDLDTKIREVRTISVTSEDDTDTPSPVPLPEHSKDPEEDDEVFTVYISGSDSRSSDVLATGRSDVNIIATINPNTRQVLLLSTPRDYYVPLSIADEGDLPDKLTHAGIYGIDVSKDTLAQFYDIDIDYYFRVNFTGFEDIIDALGGIEVNSQYDFKSGGYHFTQGINHMDGAMALSYVRERYAFPNGDYQRGIHQMQVITAVIQKAMSPEILTNYNSLMNAAQNSFVTSVPYDLVGTLVRSQLSNGGAWTINSYYVSGTGSSDYTYSIPNQKAYVTIPDYSTVDTAKEMMQKVRLGHSLATS